MTLTEFIPATVLLIFWLVVISINILTLLSAAGGNGSSIIRQAGQVEKSDSTVQRLYGFPDCPQRSHVLAWLLCRSSGYFLIRITEGSLILIIVILLLIGYTISFIRDYKLSKAFGRGVSFTLELVLFRPLFLMILGFGRARYLEKQ